MSPSLSWIEESALSERINDLTRPNRSDLPVPDPASMRPTRDVNGARIDGGDDADPRAARHRAGTQGPGSRQGPSTGSAAPLAPYQDPWSMTPAQPWTAVAHPSRDLATPGIPELAFPPSMALAARLELFRDWIRQYSGDGAFFVADPEGLPLLLERVRTSQAVTAVALERALHPLRGLLGTPRANSLCVELEDGRLVQTVWASTPIGRIAVGMAPPRPLEPAATSQVRRALEGLFNGEDGP